MGKDGPTLGQLVAANQRLIVFIESRPARVAWLHLTVGMIQETPYSFRKPEDFGCRPNRGGTEGSLFLINHWIETTPTPRASNAELVNAYGFLLRCQSFGTGTSLTGVTVLVHRLNPGHRNL